jgi:hypothetical protein
MFQMTSFSLAWHDGPTSNRTSPVLGLTHKRTVSVSAHAVVMLNRMNADAATRRDRIRASSGETARAR